MKFFIASDIHGSAYYCRRMLDAWKREGADRLVLLGDILYHGPRNDLPKDYAPKEVFAMLNEVKDSIFCVRGNCDADVDQMVLEFPIMATLLHGHTHVPAWQPFGQDNYYLNPGSTSLPKENSPHSYLLWDGNTFTWKDLDGQAFHQLVL